MPEIQGSPRFEKARCAGVRAPRCAVRADACALPHAPRAHTQLKDLGSGNFGLARLEREKATGELVAIKYIPRGSGVRPCAP